MDKQALDNHITGEGLPQIDVAWECFHESIDKDTSERAMSVQDAQRAWILGVDMWTAIQRRGAKWLADGEITPCAVQRLRNLRSEINCRREHGADGVEHLQHIESRLSAIINAGTGDIEYPESDEG